VILGKAFIDCSCATTENKFLAPSTTRSKEDGDYELTLISQ